MNLNTTFCRLLLKPISNGLWNCFPSHSILFVVVQTEFVLGFWPTLRMKKNFLSGERLWVNIWVYIYCGMVQQPWAKESITAKMMKGDKPNTCSIYKLSYWDMPPIVRLQTYLLIMLTLYFWHVEQNFITPNLQSIATNVCINAVYTIYHKCLS